MRNAIKVLKYFFFSYLNKNSFIQIWEKKIITRIEFDRSVCNDLVIFMCIVPISNIYLIKSQPSRLKSFFESSNRKVQGETKL